MKEFALKIAASSALIDTAPSAARPYLISAEPDVPAAVFAPEIAAAAAAGASVADLELLFEARARAYDYDSGAPLNAFVAPRVALLFEDALLARELAAAGLEVLQAPGASVIGGVGELYVIGAAQTATAATATAAATADAATAATDAAAQTVVSYAIARASVPNNPAIIDAREFASPAALAAYLAEHTGRLQTNSRVRFDEHICDAASTRGEQAFCSACATACPTVAIAQDAGAPIISQLDCTSCGECVAACPSNALEFCALSRDALIAISELYAGRKIAVGAMPERLAGALFFAAPLAMCDELLLLHLVQLSGHSLAICGEVSAAVRERAEFVNALSAACFGRAAVEFLAPQDFAAQADFAPFSGFTASENNFRLNKKELLARKISAWLKTAQNAGAQLPAALPYAGAHELEIAENCTLCAACAAACKQGALIADSAANAIAFNASLCTGCGYCEASCAEPGCITLSHGQMRTDAEWFAHRALAADALFACAECGRDVAPARAIKRIAELMAPRFAHDALKEYSLYCCAECKGALMMLRQAAVSDPACFDESVYAEKLAALKAKMAASEGAAGLNAGEKPAAEQSAKNQAENLAHI